MLRFRRAALLLVTAGAAAAEAGVLRGFVPAGALGIAPQASALAPMAILHDLRWLFVYHPSWPVFAAGAVGLIVVRAAVTSVLVRLAWPARETQAGETPVRETQAGEAPAGDAPPTWPRLLAANLLFTLVTAVVLSPWTVIAMMNSVTSLSWFLVPEVVAVAVLTPLLVRGGVTAGWRRGLPALSVAALALAWLAVLTADALALGFVPGWWVVPAAAALGALNAPLWILLVRLAVIGRPWLTWLPVVPVAVVLTAAGLAGVGWYASRGFHGTGGRSTAVTVRGIRTVGHPVIYVSGYDSAYDGDPAYHGDVLQRFSYRGLGSDGRPLPYPPLATHRSLQSSARLLAGQVAVLHGRTGQPVALVAESEGTLVTRTYLETLPHAGVDAVVLLSALPQPARAYYPPPEARAGRGVAAGWQLRLIADYFHLVSGWSVDLDEPFLRSLVDHGRLYRDRMLTPVPGVRMIAFLPLSSAAGAPPGTPFRIPVVELPAEHGALFHRANVQQAMVAFLTGRGGGGAPGPYYRIVQGVAVAWQSPPLALPLMP